MKDTSTEILNSKTADSSSKIIFEDNILCSQFLRDYIDLPYMKEIQPEDIEDVSDQYVPLFSEERNADRVKKVNIKNDKPFFLVSLIEHKSKIDYNVSMQISNIHLSCLSCTMRVARIGRYLSISKAELWRETVFENIFPILSTI